MTELRRRKPSRHKSAASRNGYSKGYGTTQNTKETFLICGFTVQQFLINGLGIIVCLYIGYKHATYMGVIHENHMWFSNIKVNLTIVNNQVKTQETPRLIHGSMTTVGQSFLSIIDVLRLSKTH